MLRRIELARLIRLAVLVLAACSDDDDTSGKQSPDASAIDAGDSRAHDAGGKPGATGGGHDAAAEDASTTPPMHPHTDAGMRSDASAPHPRHDAGPSSDDDDGGALDCGTALHSSIELATKPGSVLLIFDRSFSMADDWNGMPRWQAAGNTVISALTSLQDVLDLGVILYPSVTPLPNDAGLACGVDKFDSTEQLAFQPAATALQKLQKAAPSGSPNPMYAPVGSGSNDPAVGATPTTEAMDQANAALANAAFSGPATVVLVTDGEPNCAWDQTHTTDQIAGWRSAYHVDTHVMLLPTVSSGGQPSMAVTVGEMLATAGGTTLIQPSGATNLGQELTAAISHSLVQGVKSCSITIDPPAQRPIEVQLVVEEHATGEREAAAHDLGNGSGWTITTDGAHVALTGALCEDAKRGRFDDIELAYGCQTLAPVATEPPSCPIAGNAYCHGACIDVAADENNCGECDQKCGGGLTCCGGRCVDTTYSTSSCGACGSVCNGLCCAGQCQTNACGSCGTICSGNTPCCCKDGKCYGTTLGGAGTCDTSC